MLGYIDHTPMSSFESLLSSLESLYSNKWFISGTNRHEATGKTGRLEEKLMGCYIVTLQTWEGDSDPGNADNQKKSEGATHQKYATDLEREKGKMAENG